MVDYLHCIPDSTGGFHDVQQERNALNNLAVSPPLRVWRALTTTPDNRIFTSLPMGQSTLRKQLSLCNERLPANLRVANATGHGARHAFCTLAINNNVSTAVVQQASKHRDPSTLVGYVASCDNSLMEASLAIAGAAYSVQFEESSFCGVSYDVAESSDSDFFSSSEFSDSESKSKRSRSCRDSGTSKSSSSSSSSSKSRSLSVSAPILSAEEILAFRESVQKSDETINDSRTSVYHINFGK